PRYRHSVPTRRSSDLARLDRRDDVEGVEARLVGVAHDLRVLDARAPIARAALAPELLEGVEHDRVRAVADRVDDHLEAGRVRVEDRKSTRLNSSHQII